jgi:hypothetical protein
MAWRKQKKKINFQVRLKKPIKEIHRSTQKIPHHRDGGFQNLSNFQKCNLNMAAPRGIEPPTCGLGNRRSIP